VLDPLLGRRFELWFTDLLDWGVFLGHRLRDHSFRQDLVVSVLVLLCETLFLVVSIISVYVLLCLYYVMFTLSGEDRVFRSWCFLVLFRVLLVAGGFSFLFLSGGDGSGNTDGRGGASPDCLG
jgi:hypothetical protein